MTLDVVEFLRFLLHVLPKGFMRVRYYGFLANRHRAEKPDRARALRFLLHVLPKGFMRVRTSVVGVVDEDGCWAKRPALSDLAQIHEV